MKKIISLLMLVLMSFSVLADTVDLLKIKEIQIKNNKEVPEEIIAQQMSLKKGEDFSARKMIDDYINLKGLKYLEDLSIYPEVNKSEVNVIVDLKEKGNAIDLLKKDEIVPLSEREKIDKSLIVKAIEVFGNDKISSETILKEVPVNVGSYFSKTKVLEGKDNILKIGYFKDVSPEVLKYKDGIYIKYNVLENPVISGIDISGNKLIESEKLLIGLKTKVGEIYNINFLREDTQEILKKYYEHKNKYVLAMIGDIRLDQNLRLQIKVSEGIVRKIEFKKVINEEDEEDGELTEKEKVLKTEKYILDRQVELEVGEPFQLDKFQATVQNIFRLGFFKSVNREFQRIPGDPDGVNVVVLLDENKSGTIQGSVAYSSTEKVIGNLTIKDDNFFGRSQSVGISFETADKGKKNTYELSFSDPWVKKTDRLSFSSSIYKKITEEDEENDNGVEFNEVQDKNGISFSVGKGLTKNIRVSMGMKYEYNKIKKDFSHSITTGTSITLDSSLEASVLAKEKEDQLELKKIELEPLLEKELSEIYKYEKGTNPYEYVSSFNDGSFNESTGEYDYILTTDADKTDRYNYDIISLFPSITYDTRNNYLNPTKGFYSRYRLEISKVLSEDKLYFVNDIELKKFHTFKSNINEQVDKFISKNTLAARLKLGFKTKQIPTEDYYGIGGSRTLRGFDDAYEGRYQALLNLEHRFKIQDNFQLVLFYDIGTAWEDEINKPTDIIESDSATEAEYNLAQKNYDYLLEVYNKKKSQDNFEDRLRQNWGLGLRINTPLGPLRLDWAWPINTPEDEDEKFKFIFDIGQMF